MQFQECFGQSAMDSTRAERIAFAEPHSSVARFAKLCRLRQHCLEYWLQFASGAGDDAQHLRGCDLLLKRFGKIVGALPQLVEQSGVLDGDDCLISECPKELKLGIREKSRSLTRDKDRSENLSIPDHWHGEATAPPAQATRVLLWIKSVAKNISDMADAGGPNRTRGECFVVAPHRIKCMADRLYGLFCHTVD